MTQPGPIEAKERLRLKELLKFEDEARVLGYQTIAGIDEAGRGPLAGPVVAAACIIPPDVYIPKVNDSKQLKPAVREELYHKIINDSRIVYGIAIVDAETIDRINIYQATIQAMLSSVESLALSPDFLLVDGMKLPHPHIPVKKIIKGDQQSQSIAAASILAKVTRDRLMLEYHLKWPFYGFDRHKGYGTALHIASIRRDGICPLHRLTFEPIKSGGFKSCESK